MTIHLKIEAVTIQLVDSEQFHELIHHLTNLKGEILNHMAALDDKIAALTAEVARQTTVEKSALALIQGFAAQLAAAVAAAQAAGASDAQLQALTDLQTTLTANDDELSTAVAANTATPPVA